MFPVLARPNGYYIYKCDSVATKMKKNLSIVECFDADAAKAYLKRSRIEFIMWVVSFVLLTAIAISLFSIYGVRVVAANRTVLLVFAIAFTLVDLCGLVGSIMAICRYKEVKRTVEDSAAYIKQVALLRADAVYAELEREGNLSVFRSHGFYFSDIDTPYQMRVIHQENFSSNYQAAVMVLEGKNLHYKSAVFSLLNAEERVDDGVIPFERISSISVIKANGIDLFCSQLKIVFGSQCMLFALDSPETYVEAVENLHNVVFSDAQ